MNNFAMEIIKFLVASGFVTGAYVYLSKSFTDRFFARDLEKFKSELQKETVKYQIQFGQLHLDKAKVVKEIFYQFHDIKKLCRFFVGKISGSYKDFCKKPENKEYLEYDQSVVALRNNIEKNSIFFSNEFTDKMLKAVAEWQSAPTTAHFAHDAAVDSKGAEFKNEQYFEMVKLLRGDILKPLEEEFKNILGYDL